MIVVRCKNRTEYINKNCETDSMYRYNSYTRIKE